MSNLQLRIISAAFLIPAALAVIILGDGIFKITVFLIYLASLYEWIRLSRQTENKIGFSIFGVFYLSICFFEFGYLRTAFDSGLYLVLTMMLIVWASDTGAYFIGKKMGKHKMAPDISPNKTWEGMAGSMTASALVLLFLISFAPDLSHLVPNFLVAPDAVKSLALLAIGAAFGYIGQMGDLIESFLKRKAGAKDSGRLIPGHGGILDRIDSLLLISPFFVLLAIYVL